MFTQEQLFFAWLRVQENNGSAGVDGVSIDKFAANLLAQLSSLSQSLSEGTYTPLALKRVYKVEATKRRPLSIPTVRDRVVQTAITQYLTPILEPHFEAVSFAYRKGFSVDKAIRQVIYHYNAGFRWVVDADIHAYFDEVAHTELMSLLLRYLRPLGGEHCSLIMQLIEQWLMCPISEKGQQIRAKKGIPQGSPLSPLLANLYLDQLDDALLAENKKIVRFADDFLILCRTEKQAQRCLAMTGDILASLQLAFNQEKTSITHFDEGFQFLGYQFIRSLVFKKSKSKSSKHPQGGIDQQTKPQRKFDLPNNDGFDVQGTKVLKNTAQPSRKDNTTGLRESMQESAQKSTQQTAIAKALQAALDNADIASTSTPTSTSMQANQDRYEGIKLDPLLRTLYLSRNDIAISKASKRLLLECDGNTQKIPMISIDQIVVYGNAQFTTQALRLCLAADVDIHFLSATGTYQGAIYKPNLHRCALHKRQFMLQPSEHSSLVALDESGRQFAANFACAIIQAKLKNSITQLRRIRRRNGANVTAHVNAAIALISQQLKSMHPSLDLQAKLGMEGVCARAYFGVLGAVSKEYAIEWQGRQSRPANDAINSALNFLYTLLYNNVVSLLHASGLNPYIGYLHALKPNHAALASDIMEPFRSIVVDPIIIACIKEGKFNDLPQPIAGEQYRLPNELIATLIQRFEKHMNQTYRYPAHTQRESSEQKKDMRRIIADQIRLSKAWVMAEIAPITYFTLR